MTVIFRCDASSKIGLGHLSRCLALADVLRTRGVASTVVMARGEPDLTRLPVQRGHRVRALEGGAEPTELSAGDAAEVLSARAEGDADWIVVDHYGATPAYLDRLDDGPHRLCVVDDTGNRDVRGASLVVSPSPGIAESEYRGAARDCTFLLGPRFALLDPAFRQHRAESLERRRRVSRPKTVMVSLGGGSTGESALSSVLSMLSDVLPDVRADLVFGPAARAASDFNAENISIHRNLGPRQMAELMCAADLAIATPSTIAWELSCLGVPSVLIRTASNQASIAEALTSSAAAVVDEVEALPAAASRLLSRMRNDPAALVDDWATVSDGLGALRVASALSDEPFLLRPAGMEDRRWIWELNSHPSVRARSINTNPVAWEEHVAWFAKVLASRAQMLFVGESPGGRVGVLRLDPSPEGHRCYVSVAVAPEARGRGFGRRLIEEGAAVAFGAAGASGLVALIRPDNEASIRAFASAGFSHESAVTVAGVDLVQYVRTRPEPTPTDGERDRSTPR